MRFLIDDFGQIYNLAHLVTARVCTFYSSPEKGQVNALFTSGENKITQEYNASQAQHILEKLYELWQDDTQKIIDISEITRDMS